MILFTSFDLSYLAYNPLFLLSVIIFTAYQFFLLLQYFVFKSANALWFWSYFTVDCSTQPVLLFVPHARRPAYEKFMRALMGLDVSNGALLRTPLPIATQAAAITVAKNFTFVSEAEMIKN